MHKLPKGIFVKLYNTMTRQKEDFTAGDAVRMYVCGVTPYDTTHAGHAFTYVVFDVLARYLRYQGYGVRYVQNVTDIDDDILKRARETNVTWDALGNEQTALVSAGHGRAQRGCAGCFSACDGGDALYDRID